MFWEGLWKANALGSLGQNIGRPEAFEMLKLFDIFPLDNF
jgi:hypothetical protein